MWAARRRCRAGCGCPSAAATPAGRRPPATGRCARSTRAASASGLELDPGNLAAASLGMIPLGLLVAAIGYLAAGWLRTAAGTGLLSVVLAAWFFISFIGPELKWPDAALRLSAFYYYGTPLLHGLKLTSVVGVLAVSGLALGLGALRFARKDIAAG